MKQAGERVCGALLAAAYLAGCSSSTIGSLSIDLVLPESPAPSGEVQRLRIDAAWDGGHIAQESSYADGGVRLELPTGTALELRIEGLGATAGPALWRGQAHGVTVPERGNEAVRLFFGKVGGFSHFASLAEMPPLAGTAAVPWGPGQVILAGGLSSEGSADDGIWIYDHQRVRVSRVGGLMTARSFARALALKDGQGQPFLMVAGGLGQGGGRLDEVELFQPPSTHLPLSRLIAPQRLPGGVPLDPAGQQILVGCGGGAGAALTQVQIYQPSVTLADGGPAVLDSPPRLSDDCQGGQITKAQDGIAALVSGESRGGIERIEWTRHSVGPAGAASSARAGFAAIDSPRGLVLIGGRTNSTPSDEVNRVDGGTGRLLERRDDFGWLVVPDAGVLIVGGRSADAIPKALAGAEWVDLATLGSTPAGQMEVGRIGSAVVQIPGYDAALIVSGGDESGTPVGGLEIYTYP